jgi:hypothetical protein
MSRRRTDLAKYRRGTKCYPYTPAPPVIFNGLVVYFDANKLDSVSGYYKIPPQWTNIISGGISYNADISGNTMPLLLENVVIQSFKFVRSPIISIAGVIGNYMSYLQPVNMLYNFTYCAWIKTVNGIGDGLDHLSLMHLISNQTGDVSPSTGFSIGIDSNGKLAYGDNKTDIGEITVRSLRLVNSGLWTFIAVTRDSTNGVVSLYINGILEKEGVCNDDALVAGTHVRIGSINRDTGKTFGGNIGAILGYSAALTAADILNNFNAQRQLYTLQ